MKHYKLIGIIIAGTLWAHTATATPIIYRPTNPIFQPGNSLNGPTLLSIAEIGRPDAPSSSTSLAQRSASDVLLSSLYASINSQIRTSIFSSDPGDSGTFNLGDGTVVDFINNGVNYVINVDNGITGEQTEISFPVN